MMSEREQTVSSMSKGGRHAVAALYCFAPLPDFRERRAALERLCGNFGITGTLLLAEEGVNGTIAGARSDLESVVAHLRAVPGFEGLEVKWSEADRDPFIRLKVRLKREIVTMGVSGIDPRKTVGSYVAPEDWNALIRDPDVVVVDARNDYEVAIGTFEGAVNPETTTFREFPGWLDRNLAGKTDKKIAMFCTGGIRCEKATAYLKSKGFQEVYHLKGGILRYLETVPEAESRWRGECFVFDQRVSVGHGLTPGPLQLCSVCRQPFKSGAGRGGYADGFCADCEANAGKEKKLRASERMRQIGLAKARGKKHIGVRD